MRRLPPDFLFGCGTAAHQVEGGTANDWTRWVAEDPSRIADRSDAAVACDHYSRYREDLRQLGSMHHNAHRMSIEWSRVEPREGWIDRDALRHYADVIATCRRAGMEPVVTLQHFTLPSWLSEGGGLLHPRAPQLFARYAAACLQSMRGTVQIWLTLNEPAVLAVMGYVYGVWPPGEQSLSRCFAALRAMARMHAAGAAALRAVSKVNGWEVRVSIAHAERPQRPSRKWSPLDRLLAAGPDWLFNRWFLRACQTGRLLPPVGANERIPGLRGSLDYLGVNYYSEDVIRFDPGSPRTLFVRQMANPELPTSSFGWSIDPPAMTMALRRLWDTFHQPILITENGVADEHDELRPQFILDHLNAVLDAIDIGVVVLGYLHWTSWDNFEWAEGYSKRFGLFAVDPVTQRRTPKPSAGLFAEVARRRVVPRHPDELSGRGRLDDPTITVDRGADAGL